MADLASSRLSAVAGTSDSARVEGILRARGESYTCVVDDAGDGSSCRVAVSSPDGHTEWSMTVPSFAYTVLREALGGYGQQTVNHWIFDHVSIQSVGHDIQFFFGKERMRKRRVSPEEQGMEDDQLRDVLQVLASNPGAAERDAMHAAIVSGFERVAVLSKQVGDLTKTLASMGPIPEAVHSLTEATREVQGDLAELRKGSGEQLGALQNRLEAVASESNAALGRVQGSFEEFKSEQRDAVASAKAEVQAEVEPRLAEVETSTTELAGQLKQLRETTEAELKARAEAHKEAMADMSAQLSTVTSQLPMSETAQKREMAEFARDLQTLRTTLEEERRQRAADAVAQAATFKRQLEALQAERAADLAAAQERMSKLHEEVASMRAKSTAAERRTTRTAATQRRSHVQEALSKLKELETSARSRVGAGPMSPPAPPGSQYSPSLHRVDSGGSFAFGGAAGNGSGAGGGLSRSASGARLGATGRSRFGNLSVSAAGVNSAYGSPRGPGLTQSFLRTPHG